jgi:hypothetical protein
MGVCAAGLVHGLVQSCAAGHRDMCMGWYVHMHCRHVHGDMHCKHTWKVWGGLCAHALQAMCAHAAGPCAWVCNLVCGVAGVYMQGHRGMHSGHMCKLVQSCAACAVGMCVGAAGPSTSCAVDIYIV